MDRLAKTEGVNDTLLSGVKIFKASQYHARQPLCYEQGVFIIGQGSKQVFLDGSAYTYDHDTYLVLSVPLPAECETHATRDKPLLSLMLDIDMGVLNKIIGQMGDDIDHTLIRQNEKHQGLFLARTTPDIKNSVDRLLSALLSPLEARVLGRSIAQELLFRIICGENAAATSVGYESATQFSREFKRYFGTSPVNFITAGNSF